MSNERATSEPSGGGGILRGAPWQMDTRGALPRIGDGRSGGSVSASVSGLGLRF
jgi:hypothetical protein